MMKKLLATICILLMGLPLWAGPVEDLLGRVLPHNGDSQKFTIKQVESSDPEYFILNCDGTTIQVEGNSLSAITSGINWYLHHYAGVDLNWNGMTATLPATLPVVTNEKHPASVGLRYYLNYCTYSYTMAFWGWERWQQEIDWMALHGINMPLALVGTGSVWKSVLEHYGYTFEQINNFVGGPAFQAWFLMNNLQGWGGPNTEGWYSKQEALQDSILSRMTALGITPILPGYAGMLPSDFIKHLPAGWVSGDILSSGTWCNYIRPSFIDNTDRLKEFAAVYYHKQDSLFGKYCSTIYYSMDPFHEGGAPSGITSTSASYQAMYDALKAHNSQGVWVAQSWGGNPTQALMNTVPQKELIVLDLFSDGNPKWSTGGSYSGHPWIYCMLHNFGGRVGLHGRIARIINGFYSATASTTINPAVGIGATPEGIETNPVLYDLLFELPWTRTITKDLWAKDYVFMRYGKSDAALEKAWSLLTGSVYNCTTSQQGTSESILCARPALTIDAVSSWSTSSIYWDPYAVIEAAEKMLSVKDDFKDNNNYAYDLVDVMRQCIATYSYYRLAEIKTAKESGNAILDSLTSNFLTLILDQDSLLGTRSEFRLGTWTSMARAQGDSASEKNWYEYNARVQITSWGKEAQANGGGLRDYSNREWNGMLKGYYYPRWRAFFNGKCNGITASKYYNNYELPFVQGRREAYGTFDSHAQGDAVEVAQALFDKYFKNWRKERGDGELKVGGIAYTPFIPDTAATYTLHNFDAWKSSRGGDAWGLIPANSDYSAGYRLGWRLFDKNSEEFHFVFETAADSLFVVKNMKAQAEGVSCYVSSIPSSDGYQALTMQPRSSAEPFMVYVGTDGSYLLQGTSSTFYPGADCRWGGPQSCVLYNTDPASTSLKCKLLLDKVIPEGVENTTVDANARVSYYDLLGRKVSHPVRGIYVKQTTTSLGTKAQKVVQKP